MVVMTNLNGHEAQLSAEQIQSLWSAARSAQSKAYAPYSRYQVGVALLDENGDIHSGCNVENATYPQGWCAEASALSAMVMAGARQVSAVLLVGSGNTWVTPCGGCRQKLREFAGPDTPIYSASAQALGSVHTLGQLLPHSFGPDQLDSV